MKSKNLRDLNRREFIKVATAMGITASTLQLGTQSGLARSINDPKEEISYVAELKVQRNQSGEPVGREPVYRTIQREDWADVQATEKAMKRIHGQLEQEFADTSLLSVGMTRDSQSPTGLRVEVDYYIQHLSDGSTIQPTVNRADIVDTIPDNVSASVGKGDWKLTRSGIPVAVNKMGESRPLSYSHDWDDPPAGCAINAGTANGSYYYDSTTHLATAGHVVGEPQSEWGNPTKSKSEGYVVKKEKVKNEEYRDLALLRPYTADIQPVLRKDNTPSTDLRVSGTVTDEDIKTYYLRTGKEMKYQGSETGRKTTTVKRWEEHSNKDTDQVVHVEQDSIIGDSGGLFFKKDPDFQQMKVMGIIADSSTNYGTKGNSAESFENWVGSGYFA